MYPYLTIYFLFKNNFNLHQRFVRYFEQGTKSKVIMFNKSSECSNEKSIDSLSLWTFNYIWLALKKRFHFKWATNVNQAQPPNEKKFYSHVKMRICVWLCDLIWINQSTKLINISIFPWIQVDTALCLCISSPSLPAIGRSNQIPAK